MIDVYLFGINSVSRILVNYLKNDDRYSLLGVTATQGRCDVSEFCGLPVIPLEDISSEANNIGIINCIGYADQLGTREYITSKIANKKIPILSYVHPSAIVDGVEIGQGCIVMNQVVIEPYSKIGEGNVFYGGCYVCHEALIGDYNWFSAGCVLAGRIRVGNRNFIGINASIRDGITIGSMSTIGMGAVVTKNVESNATVVGNPAIEMGNLNRLENK